MPASDQLHPLARAAFRPGSFIFAAFVSSLVFLTACIPLEDSTTTPPSESQQELRRKLVEVERRAVMGEVEAERLREKVARLEAELEEARSSARATSRTAPQTVGSQPLDDNTGRIEVLGKIEETELEEEPLPPPSSAPSSPAPPRPDTSRPEPPAAGVEASGAASAQELYDRGYALFHQKRYAEAEAAFRQVLAAHRSSPLADNAQFWIGECRYARGDFSSALTAYSATVEQFPSGNKVPDAMLKAGRCLEALGQTREAAEIYQEIRRRFSGTIVADQAAQRLAGIGN